MKGNLTDSKNLGNKKLAYPIKKEATGYYYVLNFEATPEIVAEVDRKARIDESVLRHMIIRLDEE
jgi:small subunit ribosomal protein S6